MSKLLLDADVLCYRAAFSCSKPEHTVRDAVDKVDELINHILDFLTKDDPFITQNEDYQLYLTGKGNFRHEVAKTYKMNRQGTDKPQYHTEVRQRVIDYWGAIVSEGEEADDLIAIEATRLKGDCVIVSVDKDFKTVECMLYNPSVGSFEQITKLDACYYFYLQCLTGDRVDNVPGIYGVGPKKAQAILKDLKDEDSMYNAVLAAYNGNVEEMHINAKLLWLRRYVGEIWDGPGFFRTA